MINAIILAASYALSGFFMKFSDDEFDEKNNIDVRWIGDDI